MRSRTLLLTLAATFLLAACGHQGVPMPPSLHLAKPVQDLRASRRGDTVTLTWIMPVRNTDETVAARHIGTTRICRAGDTDLLSCDHPIGTVVTASGAATFTDKIQPVPAISMQKPGTVRYAVEVLNKDGKSAGLSNLAVVSLAATWEPPARVDAKVTADGVIISWPGTGPLHLPLSPVGYPYFYRVLRRAKGTTADAVVGELPVLDMNWPAIRSVTDTGFTWEQTYDYRVQPVTKLEGEILGVDSPATEVFVHDVFPPAVPAGLQAVSSGPAQQIFVDLTWSPGTDVDLAGYNVYRSFEGAGGESKLTTEIIKTPSFRDTSVEPGKRYLYTVTAVDLRGNESAHSQAAGEMVPK